MQLGLFSMPLHHPDRDYLTVLKEDQEAVILGDELGFSEAWIGEHFSTAPEGITSPFVFLASVIEHTKNIRLGTGVINLPQQHPAIVAGLAAMFDQLSEGRLMFGIGPGGLPSDFELFKNTDAAERPKMMAESIDMILQIWAQDPPYEIKGEYWDISLKEAIWPELGVGRMAKPYQKPHPPIAASIMSPFSSSARRAAERGWIPVSANFIPANNVASHWQVYAEASEQAGRAADPSIWRVARSILVTESDAEAEDYVNQPDGVFHFYFTYLLTLLKAGGALALFKTDPDMSDDDITVEGAIAEMVIAGSPKTVLDKLMAFREAVGDFGTLLMTGHDWDDAALWRRSMELLATDVVPRMGDSGTSRAAE